MTSIFAITLLTLINVTIATPKEKEKSELYEGERQLTYKQRITAEGRYKNLKKKINCHKDKDEIVNQLLYIKNGYYDFGYLPIQKNYCESKNIPEGFWVYVYPYWFIWKTQKLF